MNFLVMMLRHLKKFLDEKTMINVYYAFVYAHILYGLEFWGHACQGALLQILVCQNKPCELFLKSLQIQVSHINSTYLTLCI